MEQAYFLDNRATGLHCSCLIDKSTKWVMTKTLSTNSVYPLWTPNIPLGVTHLSHLAARITTVCIIQLITENLLTCWSTVIILGGSGRYLITSRASRAQYRGWTGRNIITQHGRHTYFCIPLKLAWACNTTLASYSRWRASERERRGAPSREQRDWNRVITR